MRGHTKFLGGLQKIEGARLSGGLLQRGVCKPEGLFSIILYFSDLIFPLTAVFNCLTLDQFLTDHFLHQVLVVVDLSSSVATA